jgi:hypothetical protein
MTGNPIPDVSSRYGTLMGRPNAHPGDITAYDGLRPRIHLRRIPINGDGYDAGRAYWGLGQPLWAWCPPEGGWSFLRAATREAAKAAVREEAPDARFYR